MASPLDALAPSALPDVDLDLTRRGGGDGLAWEVVQLSLDEALSRPWRAQLVVACAAREADPGALLEEVATLSLRRGEFLRRWHGVVWEVEDLGAGPAHRFARVELTSALRLLEHRVDTRIFQGLNVAAIVAEVMREAALPAVAAPPAASPSLAAAPPREYCVQYQESDLAFVTRLLEEEGASLFTTHTDDGELVTLMGDELAWPAAPTFDGADVPVANADGATLAVESVDSFDVVRRARAAGVALRDFDFTRPSLAPGAHNAAEHPRGEPRSRYEHPGRFQFRGYDESAGAYTAHDGARLARVRHEEHQSGGTVATAEGDFTGAAPGHTFGLVGHLRADLDQRYLVTAVRHEAQCWGDLVEGVRSAPRLSRKLEALGARWGDARYASRFECVPAAVRWRPTRATPRPLVHGSQTATVMAAPDGGEVSADVHGRVRVRFHWDRPERRPPSQRDARTSCWIRVAQAWAGGSWGAAFVPRAGMEVVVQFLDGDPDRPLLTGCVYNGQNRAPFDLPAGTRAGLRTRSTPAADGFNELSFEDRAGGEQVYLRAQRDLDAWVLRSETRRVDVDQSLRVGHDRTALVCGQDDLTVGGDRSATVDRDDLLRVEGAARTEVHGEGGAELSVDHDHRVRVEGESLLVARRRVVIECGTSRIVMTPDRITLSAEIVDVLGSRDVNVDGGMVNINCDDDDGGAPTRAAAMRDMMARLGMGDAVEAMARDAEPTGIDARRLWRRTAAGLQEYAADHPEMLRERLVLRAGAVLGQLLRDVVRGGAAAGARPHEKAVAAAVEECFGPLATRADVAGDASLRALVEDGRAHALAGAAEGAWFAAAFHRAMSSDPAWGAVTHDDPDGARDLLDRQGRLVAQQRVVAWSLRHDGVAGEPRVRRAMGRVARLGVRRAVDASTL